MDFMTQVARVGKYMSTREQIAGYFQREFPGDRNWRSEFARRLQPHTHGKNGAPIAYSSVRRRFEGDRMNRPVPDKLKGEYEALGKQLPRMPPERGYHVKGKVCIEFSGGCEERIWDYKVVATVAADLYKSADLQGLVNVYMGEDYHEEDPSYPLCNTGENEDQELTCKSRLKVTALSKEGARHLPNIDDGI